VQIQANIQPGDSGGALVGPAGTVVGVITAGAQSGSTTTEGFAIPLDTARSIANQIVAGQSSSTVHIGGSAYLGVEVSGSALGAGIDVVGVQPNTPAASAGIVAGDSITAVNGQAATTPDQLHTLLNAHRPGDRVQVTFTDQTGASHTVTVTLATGPVG